RSGDFAATAAIAHERPFELPIPRREELVADLALAATSHVSEDERERLESDLADPALRAWVDAVAPGLAQAAHATGHPRTRVEQKPAAPSAADGPLDALGANDADTEVPPVAVRTSSS